MTASADPWPCLYSCQDHTSEAIEAAREVYQKRRPGFAKAYEDFEDMGVRLCFVCDANAVLDLLIEHDNRRSRD